MADRSILVKLLADISDFKGKFEAAGKAAGDLADRVEKSSVAINKVGSAATAGGLVIAAGLGFAAKAAIDWESAWAGVTKTVDGSASQLATLEGELRNMAKTLPASHQEIAKVAEAAGQLGVKTEDVAGFTKVMIDLGETTNLTADEAATSLAQLMNVMGTSAGDVSRLGSAIVDLGNKGASTERDIVQMGQRIAAAGKSVGMSETQVLGFASALASVGVEAEAGGTAISTTFKQIDTAVRAGGDALDLLAKTSGMTSAEFAQAWGTDAAGATQAFVEGLGQMQKSGQDANGVLTDLGMTGMRQTDSLMRLAQAGSLLGDNLRNSAAAWSENSALAEEAGKRYATTESQIKIAWNNIKDAAIDAGGAMLPMIADLAQNISGLAQSFAALPAPVRDAGVQLAAIGAGALLAVGGASKLLTTGLELRSSLVELAAVSPKASGALGALGKAAGVAAVALIALKVLYSATDGMWQGNIQGSRDLTASLQSTTNSAATLNKAFQFTEGIISRDIFTGVGESLKRAFDPTGVQSFADAVNGLFTTSMAGRIKTQTRELDAAWTALSGAGKGDLAAAQFRIVAADAATAGLSVTKLVDAFPEYRRQLEATAAGIDTTTLSAQDWADWMGGKVPPAIQAAAAASKSADPAIAALAGSTKKAGQSAEDARAQMLKLASAMLQLSGSQMGFEAAIDDAAESIKKYGKASLTAAGEIDISSEKGRALKASLDGVAASALGVIDNMVKTGASSAEIAAFQQQAAGAFLDTAKSMGLSSDAALILAGRYGLIPKEVATQIIALDADLSRGQIEALIAATAAVPALTNAQILAPGARPSKDEVDALIASIGTVPGLTEAQVRTLADLYGVNAVLAGLASVYDKTVTITTINRVEYVYGSRVASGTGGGITKADGGFLGLGPGGQLVETFANGGFAGSFRTAQPQIRAAGGRGVLWAEDGAGPWEAFVSGHPAKRAQSRLITAETARRLGGDVVWQRMADGGFAAGSSRGGHGSTSVSIDVKSLRDALNGAELRLTGAVDTIGDAVAGRILLAYEGAV